MVFKIIGGIVVVVVVGSIFKGCFRCPLKDIMQERPAQPQSV